MWKNRHSQTPYHRVWRKDNNMAMDSKQNSVVYKNRPAMDFRELAVQTGLHVLTATTTLGRSIDACKHGILRNPHTQRTIAARISGLPSTDKMESIPWEAETEPNRQLPRCHINRRTTQIADSSQTLFRWQTYLLTHRFRSAEASHINIQSLYHSPIWGNECKIFGQNKTLEQKKFPMVSLEFFIDILLPVAGPEIKATGA
jgi:hypothetical protein